MKITLWDWVVMIWLCVSVSTRGGSYVQVFLWRERPLWYLYCFPHSQSYDVTVVVLCGTLWYHLIIICYHRTFFMSHGLTMFSPITSIWRYIVTFYAFIFWTICCGTLWYFFVILNYHIFTIEKLVLSDNRSSESYVGKICLHR